jgi:hypothetical protein
MTTPLCPVELESAAQTRLEALRSAGQYDAAWNQARALAQHAGGQARELKFWIVACEAARYLSRPADASEALAQAREAYRHHARGDQAYSLALWLTIGELNVRWADADIDGARTLFDLAGGPDEQTLSGDKAVLYAVMLAYAAAMELDCGNWERARSLLARARALAERVGEDFTRRFAVAGQSLLRLGAHLAFFGDGDMLRSLREYEAALHGDQCSGQLGGIGLSSAFYAAALSRVQTRDAMPHAERGLEIVRRYYPGDRLTRCTVALLPVLARHGGAAAADAALLHVPRTGLGLRDTLLLDVAEAKRAAYHGRPAIALERAEEVANRLTSRGMHAWACEAYSIGIEASLELGDYERARRALSALRERFVAATAQTRARMGSFEEALVSKAS